MNKFVEKVGVSIASRLGITAAIATVAAALLGGGYWWVKTQAPRETMKAKRSSINSTERMCYVFVAIALLLTPLNFYTHAWGLAFSIVTCLMMLFCAVAGSTPSAPSPALTANARNALRVFLK